MDGTVPKLLQNTYAIMAAKRHAVLLETNLRYLRGPHWKELSSATKTNILVFSMENMKTHWKLVLFTVRKKFSFKFPGVKVGNGKWLTCSEEHISSQVNHASNINIYADLSPYGMTLVHEVADTKGCKTASKNRKGQSVRTITSEEYVMVMTVTLLPGDRRRFIQGGGLASWTYKRYNGQSHKFASSHINAWYCLHGSAVKFLPNWPPKSPAMNPIEHVWG